MLGRPVVEISGSKDAATPIAADAVVVGTEAALHRVRSADLVGFLDFDQELLAPRYRATEEALALLARASRLVGGRTGGGRLLVATRLMDHAVYRAVVQADPGPVTEAETARRRALGFPPFGSVAEVGDQAGPEFVDRLIASGLPDDIEVHQAEPRRWVIQAPTAARMAEALSGVRRPPGRLRLRVDALRF